MSEVQIGYFNKELRGKHVNVLYKYDLPSFLGFTFSKSGAAEIAVIFPFPGAEIKHVNGHRGSDLLLGQAHAVVENLEELF